MQVVNGDYTADYRGPLSRVLFVPGQESTTLFQGTVSASGLTPSFAWNSQQFNALAMSVNILALTGTSPTFNLSFQYTNDGTSWSSILGTGTLSSTSTWNTVYMVPSTAIAVRASLTLGGTTPSATYTADCKPFYVGPNA